MFLLNMLSNNVIRDSASHRNTTILGSSGSVMPDSTDAVRPSCMEWLGDAAFCHPAVPGLTGEFGGMVVSGPFIEFVPFDAGGIGEVPQVADEI